MRIWTGIALFCALVAASCETPVETVDYGGSLPGRFGQCSDKDKADCLAAYATIQALHTEVASCRAADECTAVAEGMHGGPSCDNTFSCPFAVRRDVDLTQLAAQVKAVDGKPCTTCAEACPPVPCPPPAPAATCNTTTGMCELKWQ